ncbi:ABC-2 type transport system permease protein [Chitinophaga eiseniae]|uniref:ABC-2 type transport system permease protein n=1 Tax=Chitinophaga eiseniae TaxID=634771 RepID=A0A1T4TMA9_9BACT|nr:DUF3526 domain-containing protein [Chitinophaga eiseniae]SKA41606.1 ABC-2 type transport system permease protein [Chitinophaga eiseniae]
MKRLYQFECILFFRTKAAWWGVLILLLSGAAGLYLGKSFIDKQRSVIQKAAVLQPENTQRNLRYFGNELGLMLYHNKYTLVNQPDPWAAFATGQRDINPVMLTVSMLGLQGQMYDTDLNNPVNLLYGNIDLAFVFVFLFPLVIIAFTYNVLSAEQESGVWRIISAQADRPQRLILRKLLVRIAVVLGVALLLLLSAVVYLRLPPDGRLVWVSILLLSYLLFWFALSCWVISYGRSSGFNLAALIACWVLLNMLVPALVNIWTSWRYPVPEAMETAMRQREGYHEKWDVDKSVTMDKFFAHYPQFRKYPFDSSQAFSWYWYYGMQQMGDDEAAASTKAMREKLRQRQRFSNAAALVLPGIQATLQLNSMAGTDLQQYLQFQSALQQLHEEVRMYFYPLVFSEGKTAAADWNKFALRYFEAHDQRPDWRQGSILLLAALLAVMAVRNFRQTLKRSL